MCCFLIDIIGNVVLFFIGNFLIWVIMYLLSKNEFNFRSECYVNYLISKFIGCVYLWL